MEKHPLVIHAEAHNLTRYELADLLEIPRGAFKLYVSGHRATTWRRARGWEERRGISAEAVMRWQDEHCRPADARSS